MISETSIYKTVNLSDIVDISIGKTPSRNNNRYWGQGYNWVSISDLKDVYEIFDTKEQITEVAIRETRIKIVPKGTILFSFKLSIGKVAITGKDIYTNEAIAAFRIKKNFQVDRKYLYYVVKEFDFTRTSDKAVMGLTLNQKKLRKLQIPLPSLEPQKKIAAILDKADELRRNDQKILEKYDQLARSVFLEMFGDPVTNPKGWEKGPTINYCDCIVPGRNKPKSFTGDIPWVTTEDLVYRGTTLDSKKKICLSIEESKEAGAKVIPAMSVIMTCVGDLGIVSINQKEMVVNQQLHTFQCKSSILPLFLMYNLSFQTPYMHKMASNTTVPYLNKTMCNNTPAILPPIVLQKRFAEIIIHIETQKKLTQQSLQKSEELFQSLLQRSFKGELS